jgi:hypothetical protein
MYRGTSLIKNTPLLGPYSRAMHLGLYDGPTGGGKYAPPPRLCSSRYAEQGRVLGLFEIKNAHRSHCCCAPKTGPAVTPSGGCLYSRASQLSAYDICNLAFQGFGVSCAKLYDPPIA